MALSAILAWTVPARELAAVFLSLVMIIGASSGIFWLLVRRWTTQRHWVALGGWGDENRVTLRGEERAVGPQILKGLTQPAPKGLVSVNDADTGIVEIEAQPPKGEGTAV